MKILVCGKQVPDFASIQMREETKSINRNTSGVINPFDLYAMEAANRIKDDFPKTKIYALTMGPEQGRDILCALYALGADNCTLITDPAFSNADVQMTAFIIKKAINLIEKKTGIFDAIFCGCKTVDSGSLSFPPYLSECLNRGLVTHALSCEPYINTGKRTPSGLTITKEGDQSDQKYQIPFPCIVSFTRSSNSLRYPLIQKIIDAPDVVFQVFSSQTLFPDSIVPKPGILVKSFKYRNSFKHRIIINMEDEEESGRYLAKLLVKAHII